MKTKYSFVFLLLSLTALLVLYPLSGQNQSHQIIDHVEVPAELNQAGDSACYIEFRETWTFLSRGALKKEVGSLGLSCSGEQKDLRLAEGGKRIKDIHYEFMLLDPHLVKSGNHAFPEPDSMDGPTRKLQASFIELIRSYGSILKGYHPDKQLLSVYFHEEWEWGSNAKGIRKKVVAIAPVIWQRRQTTEGEGIDDPDSGLPVYYKTTLQRIYLRQP